MKYTLAAIIVGLLFGGGVVRARAQQVAFTWDDLPALSSLPVGHTRVEIISSLITAMQHEHMPAPMDL